ncbi:MAG: PAS domain S-box protein [Gemmatimonadaceae bacterium]|nr:PAS domain S-box protein [Gemmatimonadaceae bacterium]
MRRLLAAVLATAVVLARPVASQQAAGSLDAWRRVQYGTRDGIRSPIVGSLAMAADGTVWVGHAAGIAWFDGWRWRTARSAPTDILTRQPSQIRPMHGDSVLVVMHNLLFVGDTSGFTQREVFVDGKQEQVLDALWTPAGFELLVGVGQRTDTVRYMRWSGDSLRSLDPPAPIRSRLVASLHASATGGVLLNTSEGLYERVGDGWALRAAGRGQRVLGLLETPDGRLVAGLLGAGAGNGTYSWRRGEVPRRDASEGDDELAATAFDGDSGVFAVRRGGYLRRRDRNGWRTVEFAGTPLNDVRAVLRDPSGDLWIGTGQGVVLLRTGSRLWSGRPLGFPSLRDRVNALLRLPNGDLWAGTADGIDIFHADGRRTHVSAAAGVPVRTVTALARDSAGHIWVGSGSELSGALRYDGRAWRHFTARDGLGAEHVHRIVVSPRGVVWFLGIGGSAFPTDAEPGAWALTGDRFSAVTAADGLPSGRVYDFAEAPDGTQWFAHALGLSRRRGAAWTHWLSRRGRSGTMNFRDTPIRVFSLALDSVGTAWFGSADSEFPFGLGTVEADTLRFYAAGEGPLSSRVRALQFGRDGALWVASAAGLSAFRDGVWYAFGTDRGLGFPELWPLLVADSTVTLGTLGGGVRVLSVAELRHPAPRVLVDPPTVGTGLASVSWTAYAWRGIQPAALVETRHRFDGGPWSAWSTARALVAPLRGGAHTLEVQAKGLYAPLDGPIARVSLDVPGPLVTRPAFIVPLAGLLLVIGALVANAARRQQRDAAVLRESEGRFRVLASSTSEGIAIHVDGSIVEANEQLERLVGVPSGALAGRRLEALFDAPAPPVADGEAVSRHLLGAGGTARPVAVRERATAYRGAPARVTAIHDLTERIAAGEALRASKERFETLFRRSPTAVVLITWPEATFVEVSEGFEVLTGLDRADVVGRTSADLGLYQDPAQRAALFAGIAADGRADNVPLTIRRRDGALRDVLGTFVRLAVDGREHVLGVIADLTDRRRLEAQLLQAQKMEAVGRLAGGVAHDFNNLLTVILGNADTLLHAVEGEHERRDAQEIRLAAQRAADLTRQLLTFARKQPIAPELVDLGEVIPRTQRMLARLLGERIALDTHLAADVPHVLIDAGQLEQVLVNLAVNARDAMPEGGRLTIEARAVVHGEAGPTDGSAPAPGRYAMIAITDTGVGIPTEALPRIFEPFFTTKEVGHGTGLGLAICYGIVREAGGHIAVESTVGAGTTVRVLLPARTAERVAAAPAPTRTLVGGTERILLVEDQSLVRGHVERLLTGMGYAVTAVGDEAEALAALSAIAPAPALLLTDIVLPGPAGPEIARRVRERVPGIAVLYISGYTERGALATTSLDAPLLPKPFTPEQLATAVRSALDGRGEPAA